MKYIFICAMFCAFNDLSAQTNNKVSPPKAVYNLISPDFPGGKTAKSHFLSTNIQYPIIAKENKIQGVVELKFIVESDGSLTNFQILSDPGGGLGEEALRVYQLMPNWTAGELYGQPTRVPVTESVNFRLSPSKPVNKQIK